MLHDERPPQKISRLQIFLVILPKEMMSRELVCTNSISPATALLSHPAWKQSYPPSSCLNSVSISGVIKQTGIVFIKSSWLSFCPCRRWNIFKQIPPGGRIEKLKRTFERRFSWVPGPQLDFTEESTYWVPHIIPTPNPGQPFLTPWELSLIELSQNAVCLVYISALFLAELAVYLSAKPFCFLDFLFSLLFDLRGGRTPMSPVC